MTDQASNRLKPSDRQKIRGFEDIVEPEIDQILPPTLAPKSKETSNNEKLAEVRKKASSVKERIKRLKEEVDNRCAHLKVTSVDGKGSPLFTAMVRVFGERTLEVTYDHYKRALEKREQLIAEDREELKKQ